MDNEEQSNVNEIPQEQPDDPHYQRTLLTRIATALETLVEMAKGGKKSKASD